MAPSSPPAAAPPLDEFTLIARYFAPIAGAGGLGLQDDVAILTPPEGCDLILTKDMLVAGVHFFAADPPGAIAKKALRVNLSDLAAKGAAPLGFLLGFGWAHGLDETWLAHFAAGLAEDAAMFGCPLLGGDTVRAPALTLSLTLFGAAPRGAMPRRQGGAPGHRLYVSGTIGDSALGLRLRLDPDCAWGRALDPAHRAHLLDRYLLPQPRLALAPALRQFASAAMDVSDGLIGDADKLAQALGRQGEIGHVPLSPAARAAIALEPALLEIALTGGDDYEVLAAIPPENASGFEAAARLAGVPVQAIGALTEPGEEARWLGHDQHPHAFSHRAYRHV